MNDKRQKVILYGDSLVLASVRASLELCPALEVISLDTLLVETAQSLRAFCPAAVIFDLQSALPDLPFSLLQEQPGLLLIGIHPGSKRVTLWSGRQMSALTTGDLLQVIESHANGLEKEKRTLANHATT